MWKSATQVRYNRSMSVSEWRAVSPEAVIREIEESLRRYLEDKYAFQIGLKDLDFEVDEEKARALGFILPFQSIDQAENALLKDVCTPTTFLEDDDTIHQVLAFAPEPVGYSGFMDCVTHSLALTDRGLFEVGHYLAMDLASRNHHWQWFLHRRLATSEQIVYWQRDHDLSPQQIVDCCYKAMKDG